MAFHLMRRAVEHARAGQWPTGEGAGTLTLDFDTRHRRRMRLTSDAGDDVLLDLPKAVAMAEGDGVRLEEGGWLAVRAAAEPVLEIQADSPHLLMRIAWHLGNRHLATEIHPTSLRIRPDHVIEEMLRGLGAVVRSVDAPFQPEGGAYGAGGHGHHHDHGAGDHEQHDHHDHHGDDHHH